MAASNVVSTLRRATPEAVDCFRHVVLHQPTGAQAEARARLSSDLHGGPIVVVLYTWLGAKEKYVHKYVDSWTRRGFKVLHVTTSVRDLLAPRSGADVTASRLVDYLNQRSGWKVLMHGLSVGGYLSQRTLMEARGTDLASRVSHLIYDSFTNLEGMKGGIENAVSPTFHNLARSTFDLYRRFVDTSSYVEAQEFIKATPCHSPALFMHSLADQVASFDKTVPLIECQQRGSPVETFIIPEQQGIPHVALLRYLGEQTYMGRIKEFLDKHTGYVDVKPQWESTPHISSSSV